MSISLDCTKWERLAFQRNNPFNILTDNCYSAVYSFHQFSFIGQLCSNMFAMSVTFIQWRIMVLFGTTIKLPFSAFTSVNFLRINIEILMWAEKQSTAACSTLKNRRRRIYSGTSDKASLSFATCVQRTVTFGLYLTLTAVSTATPKGSSMGSNGRHVKKDADKKLTDAPGAKWTRNVHSRWHAHRRTAA